MSLTKQLYSLGIEAYSLGVKLVSTRNPKARLLNEGQRDVWQRLENAFKSDDKVIWIHASSLGEFEQGRPLIERFRAENPEYKILLTFFSPSGYEVRKNYGGADCVCYLPFDTPRRVERFLDLAHPTIAIFVKYEFWANYLYSLKKRNIPSYLISAVFRPGQLFFKPWGGWYRGLLCLYDHIFVQDNRSKELLNSIGVTNVTVAGDTRFDRVTDILRSRRNISELNSFVGQRGTPEHSSFVMMFGSSWPQDEVVYTEWLRRNPEVKAVIAPHEFDKERLNRLKELVPDQVVLMSELKDKPHAADGKRVLIIDCFGLLSSAYSYADAAYVGGGFGVSIHNINEAAVYGIPVIFGPENSKFIEAQELKINGGGIEIRCADDFDTIADTLLRDSNELKLRGKAAGDYIRSKLGATKIIFEALTHKR